MRFLDQRRLPLEERFVDAGCVEEIAEGIRSLAIRGAPLIGIAAAYGVALAAASMSGTPVNELRLRLAKAIDLLASTRPTAVNLFWALDRQRKVLNAWKSDSLEELQNNLLSEAKQIHQEDAGMCEKISTLGAALLPPSCSVMTHCNSGILATGGRGTAVGIITRAWELGKIKHVYINETRPLLQGARLTSWEMKLRQIPATLAVDAAAAFLMQQGKIDAVIVGADRIAENGDVANKVGTYMLAVAARHHKIPFYVAAPGSTVDPGIRNGGAIPIEIRDRSEVAGFRGMQTAPDGMDAYAPAFDITPNELITAIITDRGVHRAPYSGSLAPYTGTRLHAR